MNVGEDTAAPLPFARTICDCRACSISCDYLPGALAPSDLPIIADHLGHTDVTLFAEAHLVASEGATVALPDKGTISLPTLVPASDRTGACHFLVEGRCSIHAVAPFGCSHLDAHMPDAEAGRRSYALCEALLNDSLRDGTYSRMAAHLRDRGRVAPPLSQRRAHLSAAMRREGLMPIH